MGLISDYLIGLLLLAATVGTIYRKQDGYSALLRGSAEGLKTVVSILPSLVVLLSMFHMLRASGAIEMLTHLIHPAAKFLGIPAEVIPLMLLRPISGSAALAVGADLIATYGADSAIGLTAAIMLGSTETTFYTISVYFSACGIEKTRYAIPSALCADLTGFLMAALTARWI